MANGTDLKDMVVRKVRPGLKREFEFAFRALSEFSGSSLGRTRARSGRGGGGGGVSPSNGSNNRKRMKGKKGEKARDLMVEEEEAKSDVVELGSGDEEAKEVGLIESVPTTGGDLGIEPEKALLDDNRNDDCEERSSESMLNSVNNGDLEEKNGGNEIMVDEGLKEDDRNEGISGSVPLLMEGDAKAEVEKMADVCENGTSGSTANVVDGEGGVIEPSLILVNNSNSKVEEVMKPFRRFTRSLLKEKTDMVKETTDKHGTEGSDGKRVSSGNIGSSSSSATNSGTMVKMLRNDVAKKFPTKLKELLDSGILEGQKVKYVRGSKVRGTGEAGLQGVIKGSGILCFCYACNGREVVTPTLFELHAASANKRPPEYIYLENGNTLRDVMNACKDASLETLDEALRLAIGCSSLQKSNFCLNCRGSIGEVDNAKSMVLCSQCKLLKDSQDSVSTTTDTDKGTLKPIPTATPKPLPDSKSSDKALKSSTSRSKSQGKLTTKDLRMHKLVFEEDVLPDGTEVAYYSRGQKLLVGYKKGFGIFCSCCNTEVSPSQFEAHAGWASRRKPYLHIYTSNGVSLHELSLSLSKTRKFSTHENDDLCQICKDGGDLLCCDVCPRAYHKECLKLPEIPESKWFCQFCLNNFQKEKFVERNANAIAAGRVAGVDPIEQITRRCIRIVKTLDAEFGGCFFCRDHDFDKSFGPRTVLLCDQCEKEFHVGCLKDHNMEDLKELPKGNWFCCIDCNRIHSALKRLVVRGEERLLDACLNVIRKKHEESSSETAGKHEENSSVSGGKHDENRSSIGGKHEENCSKTGDSIDVRWRLLNDKIDPSGDTAALLSEALAIFHERFDPIFVAGASGKADRDLIPAMVFGDNIKGQDLGGMYCAILLVNQVVVSCAIVRFFGLELAELPLVATSTKAQGQGYFQALFTCIEKLLGFLNIKDLVLPAAEEAESIWTNKFGFTKLNHEEFMKFRKNYQMMVFQGTSMLRKPVPKCRIVGRPEGG